MASEVETAFWDGALSPWGDTISRKMVSELSSVVGPPAPWRVARWWEISHPSGHRRVQCEDWEGTATFQLPSITNSDLRTRLSFPCLPSPPSQEIARLTDVRRLPTELISG